MTVKTVPIEKLIESAGRETVSASLDQIIDGQSEILDHLKAISQQIDASRNTHSLMLKQHNDMMNCFYEYKKTIKRGK